MTTLIGQVITVSFETVKIVNALPDLGFKRSDCQRNECQSDDGAIATINQAPEARHELAQTGRSG